MDVETALEPDDEPADERKVEMGVGTDVTVLADDRTGAIETAGAVASRIAATVPVVPIDAAPTPRPGVVVVDTGSRRLAPAAAAALTKRLVGVPEERSHDRPVRRAHKIDSTLRGNWAHELVARIGTEGRPILLVPALPSAGRVCIGGMVELDGVPVHQAVAAAGGDPVPLPSSSPAAHLTDAARRAGTRIEPCSLGSALAVRGWLGAPSGIAVADASTDADLDEVAAAWAANGADVVLAGTSAAVAAGVAAAVDQDRCSQSRDEFPPWPHGGPCLVVCGSRQTTAIAQVDALRTAGVAVLERFDRAAMSILASGGVLGLAPAPASTGRVGSPSPQSEAQQLPERLSLASRQPLPGDAAAVLADLAAEVDRAQRRVAEVGSSLTLVVVGGETAAAVLGPRCVNVEGVVVPGTPWGRLDDGTLVVTRAGGFGDVQALVELVGRVRGTLSQ